jgi:Zn-dependent peptidase ImmA (M78 family)
MAFMSKLSPPDTFSRTKAHMKKCAHELGLSVPAPPYKPVALSQFAHIRGITRITKTPLQFDGFLSREGDDLVMYISDRIKPDRYRFTFAHEIGHTYLKDTPSFQLPLRQMNMLGCRTEFVDTVREEERLCDIFAAELLLPRQQVIAIIEQGKDPFQVVDQIRKTFKVSLSAASWRFADLSKIDVGFLWFRKMGKPTDEADVKIRLDWGAFPKDDGVSNQRYIPRYDAVKDNSLVSQAYSCQSEVTGIEKVDWGGVRGLRFLVCKRFRDGVLCFAFPHTSSSDHK